MYNVQHVDNYNKIDETTMLSLADDMAAAASSFNAHGYEIFIKSRDTFKDALRQFVQINTLSN